MATNEPAPDVLRDMLDKLEQPAVRWALVCVGVVILVRLKLILFAAALPVMAYWHYHHNQSSEESTEPSADAAGDASRPPAKGNRDDDDFDNDDYGGKAAGKDDEVYDKDFWASDDSNRTAPRNVDNDDFGSSPGAKKGSGGGSWSEDPSGGPVDDFPQARSNMDDILGSLGAMGSGGDDFGLGKMGDDLDFGLGGGDDMDFLSQSFGGGFGKGASKGKGKGKGKDGKDGDKGPREPNPKQVFVAGIGDLQEDELRQFFEDMGEVDRLKVLTTPEGDSKGVCFVTFRSEEQAQKALGNHDFGGRNISVRLANGGAKGDKDKGGGKGGGRDRQEPMEFGRSERFGAAFGDNGGGDGGRFGGGGGRGGGGGKGKGRGRNERTELDDVLEEALRDQEGPLKVGDFDFAARRFLSEIRSRDRSDDTTRFNEAIDMVLKYTCSKERSSVRKWPAYVFTLLQKFDPVIWEELRERDAARRAQGPRDFAPRRNDDDRD